MNKSVFSKIIDDYFFKHSNINNVITIIKYNNKTNSFDNLPNTIIPYTEDIFNVSVFDNLNKTYTIYVCL